MDNSFTFIIRSAQKEFSTSNTNDCSIRLQGLPQKYRFFEATVSALHVATHGATIATSTFELRADGLNLVNGVDTYRNILSTVAFATFDNNTFNQSPYKFHFENFNGKSVRFSLYQDNNTLLQNGGSNYNLDWVLVLNLKGYN
jgi:hypothetical protein